MSAATMGRAYATNLSRHSGAAPIIAVAMQDDRVARFRAMFDASYTLVWRVLRRFGVPEAATDDAAQEVFMIAARKLNEIDPEKERSFLYGTARRVAADSRRARRRTPETESDSKLAVHADGAPSPEQITAQSEARAMLERILDAMDEDERSVFVLFELEGLAKSEVASALAIPEGTAASRLRRARERFFAMTEELESERALSGVTQGDER